MQIHQLQQARELASTAEQRLKAAEELNEKESSQRKRANQHRAVATRLATEAAAADAEAQRAQRGGALQSAVELNARCEYLLQQAGSEDACMGRATTQVLKLPYVLVSLRCMLQALLVQSTTCWYNHNVS